jgi:TPR repeat protein
MYVQGLGVERDWKQVDRWFRRVTEREETSSLDWPAKVEAHVALAYVAARGPGDLRDEAQVLESIGYVVTYSGDGEGFSKLPDDLLAIVSAHAMRGEVDAMTTLAQLYGSGHGVEQDESQALRWLLEAATAGDTGSQMLLAQKYESGDGVAQDAAKAREWLKKAARTNVAARYNLAQELAFGEDVAQNPRKGLRMLHRMARKDKFYVVYGALARAYRNGIGTRRDPAEALRWWRKAVEAGDTYARCDLAKALHAGEGTARDDVAAYRMFVSAAAASGCEQDSEQFALKVSPADVETALSDPADPQRVESAKVPLPRP